MEINDRISALREKMKQNNIDIYYIPTSDYHETEYVGEFFKCRKYITGFTGSAGVAVVTMSEAVLWTDGRYYIQAENELKGSEVRFFKAGMEGVPKPIDYICSAIEKNGCVGFDGRVVNAEFGEKIAEKLESKNASIKADVDLVGEIWTDRPKISCETVYEISLKYSGKSRKEKLELIRNKMKEQDCTCHVLSTLDNICWLLNLRGNDVKHFPVMLSYFVLTDEAACLYVQAAAVDEDIKKSLANDGISIKEYNDIYDDLARLGDDNVVLLDKTKVNIRLLWSIPKKCKIVNSMNPEVVPQSIKNEVELENIRKAHIKDGIACTKFMYWLKTNIGKIDITEVSAAKYLEELRREQEGFLDLSFETISAYGSNAAMMHYEATEEKHAVLKPEGLLLVDSGGHYNEGTTDITRTFALGPVTEKEKKYYTAVLQGNMRLANARFLYGCSGINLDILARGPIWDLDADYRCGTGHGVGYCLNVHEAPNGFRWKVVAERNDSCILESGQVTTDEPGYYEEGAFGIRIENELICVEGIKNEYGKFMSFENITYAPIDLDPVDKEMLNKDDIRMINAYHEMVREVLKPYLEGEELEYLLKVTMPI